MTVVSLLSFGSQMPESEGCMVSNSATHPAAAFSGSGAGSL